MFVSKSSQRHGCSGPDIESKCYVWEAVKGNLI